MKKKAPRKVSRSTQVSKPRKVSKPKPSGAERSARRA